MVRRTSAIARRRLALLGATCVAGAVVVAAGAATSSTVIASGLGNPRGIDLGKYSKVLVVETATGELTDVGDGEETLATLPGAVDVAHGGFLQTLVVTGGGPPPDEEGAAAASNGAPPPASLLRVLPWGGFTVLADIGTYQQTDLDEDDIEGIPAESNPNGVAIHGRGALVADAAGNDLLHIGRLGAIETVARFKPELVPFPAIPDPPPFFPPAGTPVPAEAVPTAVAIGPDGGYYVSELKGFPFVPGTSRIWRIEPGSRDAVCDPESPDSGACTTFLEGFTAVIDLAWGSDGTLYVLEISKNLLLAESGGDPIGRLWAVKDGERKEIVPGELLLPGGVAVAPNGTLYVTTGTFGPVEGTVVQIRKD
jgi:hypothetical protein